MFGRVGLGLIQVYHHSVSEWSTDTEYLGLRHHEQLLVSRNSNPWYCSGKVEKIDGLFKPVEM